MKKQVVRFTREKETKNAVRFQEVETPGLPKIVNTLYVQKWVAGEAQKLVVTIEEEAK